MTPRLNKRLKLSTPYRTRDDAGGYTETWSVLGEIWGAVRASSGRVGEVGGLSVSEVSLKITVRAAPTDSPRRPKPGQRLIDGNRICRIVAVTEARPDARYLICHAREEEVSA